MDQGDSSATITVSYVVDDSCPNNPGANYSVDQGSCNRFLNRAVDGCNTNFQPPYGKFGGTVTDGCGMYSLSMKVVEEVGCNMVNMCGGAPQLPQHNMEVAQATMIVSDYCSRSLTLNPTSTQTGFSQDVPTGASYDTWYKGLDGWVMWTRAAFQQHDGCAAAAPFNTGGQECIRKVNAIANKCKLAQISFPALLC